MIDWLYQRYILTFTIVLYYLVLVGFGTYQIFIDISAVSAAAATAYGSLMVLPAAAAGILKWRFSKDNE